MRISFPGRPLRIFLLILACVSTRLSLQATDVRSAFEEANKLYEVGRYAEAVAAYEKILADGKTSTAVHFNLGNALFKSGQTGRAILQYRRAQRLAPRDPDVRANLQFARKGVSGGTEIETNHWGRLNEALSLNEWTALTAAAFWLWLGLLALGQWKAEWKRALRRHAILSGVATLLLAMSLGVAARERFHEVTALVVAKEAVVRYGPLTESKSFYTLRDGAELTVLDQKDGWLQVSDTAQRLGWVRQEQVIFLDPPRFMPAAKSNASPVEDGRKH